MRAAFKIILILFLSILLAWFIYEDYWFRKAIPENIGLNYRISIGTNSGPFSGCGVAVYKLDDNAYANIMNDGLNFFISSTHARGHSGHKYGEWKQTPRHDWVRPKDWIYQLHCGNLADDLYSKILESGKSNGSYYSLMHEAALMVIPNEKLVVFTYYD